MSIQRKFIAIIVVVCCAAAIAAGFLLWGSFALRNKAQLVIPAINYLECVAKSSAIISSQSRVAADFLVTGSVASKQGFEAYNTSAELSLKEWKRAIQEQKLLNVLGESEDLEDLKNIEEQYNNWRNATRSIIGRMSTPNTRTGSHDSLILPPDDTMLVAIDAALEDGIEEVHFAYHNLLMSMGVIPWFMSASAEQMERAHIAIDYFIAVIRTADNINKQLKELMNYLLSGDTTYPERIARSSIQTEDALAKWADAVNRKNQLDGKSVNSGSLPLLAMTDSNRQIKSLIEQIVQKKQAGNSSEALTLVKHNLQTLLDKQVLPAVSLAKTDSKQAINNISNGLVDTAKSAIRQALAIIVCVALLISALVFKLMNMLSRSITQLKSGIDTIGAGNLDNRLNPQTTDGLGTLAASLDAMTERLQQSYNENASLNMRLEQQIEQLKTANHEIESFSYMVAHDLRNPVSAINCYTEILLNESSCPLDDQSSQYLERIQYSSLRLTQLIDDILQLSLVTHAEVVREKLDVSNIARQVIYELGKRYPERKVDFICQPDIVVKASAQLIRILLENLLGNAWKYSSKMDLAIIEFGQMVKDGQTVCFVRDNGVGFDAAKAENIFVAFQRLHSRQEFEGTGIGLSIVQKIVNCHQGRIWAESTVGEGATFYFTLAEA